MCLGEIDLHPVFDLQSILVAGNEVLDLFFDGPTGGRIVTDNHHPPLFRMQFEDYIDGSQQIKTLDDPGQVSHGQFFLPQIIDAAEDDRYLRERVGGGI